MKKILNFIFISFICLISISVKAETLIKQKSGYAFTRYDPRTGITTSADYYIYEIGGIVSYCIEPGISEGTNDYVLDDWSGTGLDQSLYDKLSLIAYYGYTYPGHRTMEYRMATQGLIWDEIWGSESWTRFSTDYWDKGTRMDLTDEKREILSLVSNHYKKPSFSNSTKTVYVGDEIYLEDTNNILNNFDIDVQGISESNVQISGNNITIRTTNKGKIIINMTKKKVYDNQYKIFISTKHQDMYTVGNVDDLTYKVEIDVLPKASIKITKKSSNELNNMPLTGAVYGLYDAQDNLLQELIIDDSGIATSSPILEKGTYYVKELFAPVGYELDQDIHSFSVDGKNEVIELELSEKSIETELIILKKIHNLGSELEVEDSVIFDIFDDNNQLFATITTNEEGKASVILPFGIYTIKQKNSKEGYLKVDDFKVQVDENTSKNLFYELVDEAITAPLKIVKVDSKTHETLSDVTISVYDETDTLIKKSTTDENGFIVIDNLFYGKYYIVENEAREGYKRSEEKIWFEITERNKLVEIVMENDPIFSSLRINKTDNENNPIEGVTFSIFNDRDELIDTIVTNKDGIIDIELPYGKYYFMETNTPKGYIKNEDKYYFYIDGLKEIYEYEVVNVPNTSKTKNIYLQLLLIFIGVIICLKRLRLYYL